MTTASPDLATPGLPHTAETAIDTDVHETLPADALLIPYIAAVWRRYLTGGGGVWYGLQFAINYPFPVPQRAARGSWMLDDGTAGTDP